MKHWRPRIAEAVEAALAAGATRIVGPRARAALLARSRSAATASGWRRRSADRADLVLVESWHDDPAFVEVLAERVRGTDAWVVFTAHSLPERILAEGDPYREQLLETARLVAERAGSSDWSFAFQSASTTGEPWLGPDVLEELERSCATGVEARARDADRLRLGPPRDPLGPRRRGARARGASSGSSGPGHRLSTTSRRSFTSWPSWSARPGRYASAA